MNAGQAISALRRLGVPVLRTSDAAALFQQSTTAAQKTMMRLASAELVTPVRHGIWWIGNTVDPYRLPEYLTAPLPSYLSLQTALYLRGMIDQIPHIHYAASLARTQRVTTRVGDYSIHHLEPNVFGEFEETPGGTKLATAEKALFDFAYLSSTRSRLFTSLPELELPARFKLAKLKTWLAKISSQRSRTITKEKLDQLLGRAHRS